MQFIFVIISCLPNLKYEYLSTRELSVDLERKGMCIRNIPIQAAAYMAPVLPNLLQQLPDFSSLYLCANHSPTKVWVR